MLINYKRYISLIISVLFVISGMIVLMPHAHAQDGASYYVGPSGSDNNNGTSPLTPFKSPQKAADLTCPGDTVYLMDGVYTEKSFKYANILNINNSGTAENYITYKAYENAKPILKMSWGWSHISVMASYIIIDGIIVEGNNDNITIDRALENRAVGLGTDVDWNAISDTNTNGITVNGDKTLQKDGTTIHHIIIRNCGVSKCPGGGIGTISCDYVSILNNKVYSNSWYGFYGGSGISVYQSKGIDGDLNNYKMIVSGNLVYDNKILIPTLWSSTLMDGNGIIVDDNMNIQNSGTPYKGKILVENNICYLNGGSGIHTFYSEDVDVVNNSLYHNDLLIAGWSDMFSNQSYRVNFINNIVYSRPGNNINTLGNLAYEEQYKVTFAHNVYYGGNSKPYLGFNDRYLDPRFTDTNNFDFTLQQNSPAIDCGTEILSSSVDFNGNVRPKGYFYDIGARESEFTGTTLVDRNKPIELKANSDYVRRNSFDSDDMYYNSYTGSFLSSQKGKTIWSDATCQSVYYKDSMALKLSRSYNTIEFGYSPKMGYSLNANYSSDIHGFDLSKAVINQMDFCITSNGTLECGTESYNGSYTTWNYVNFNGNGTVTYRAEDNSFITVPAFTWAMNKVYRFVLKIDFPNSQYSAYIITEEGNQIEICKNIKLWGSTWTYSSPYLLTKWDFQLKPSAGVTSNAIYLDNIIVYYEKDIDVIPYALQDKLMVNVGEDFSIPMNGIIDAKSIENAVVIKCGDKIIDVDINLSNDHKTLLVSTKNMSYFKNYTVEISGLRGIACGNFTKTYSFYTYPKVMTDFESDYPVDISKYAVLPKKILTAQVNISKEYDEILNFIFIKAIYKDGVLVKTFIDEIINEQPGEINNEVLSFPFDISKYDADSLKVFMWNSLENMTPSF